MKKMSQFKMRSVYQCDICADRKKRKRCFESGVCQYAAQMEEFRFMDEMEQEEARKGWRKVKNVETGEEFKSVLAAERTMGVAANNIRNVLNKPNRTSRGYHWITV